MKKKLWNSGVALTLLAASGPAPARWVAAGSGPEATEYVEVTTIERALGRVRVWRLIDFKKPVQVERAEGVRSISQHDEIDCHERKVRRLFMGATAGQMGEGVPLFKDHSRLNFTPIPPESLDAFLHEALCHPVPSPGKESQP